MRLLGALLLSFNLVLTPVMAEKDANHEAPAAEKKTEKKADEALALLQQLKDDALSQSQKFEENESDSAVGWAWGEATSPGKIWANLKEDPVVHAVWGVPYLTIMVGTYWYRRAVMESRRASRMIHFLAKDSTKIAAFRKAQLTLKKAMKNWEIARATLDEESFKTFIKNQTPANQRLIRAMRAKVKAGKLEGLEVAKSSEEAVENLVSMRRNLTKALDDLHPLHEEARKVINQASKADNIGPMMSSKELFESTDRFAKQIANVDDVANSAKNINRAIGSHTLNARKLPSVSLLQNVRSVFSKRWLGESWKLLKRARYILVFAGVGTGLYLSARAGIEHAKQQREAASAQEAAKANEEFALKTFIKSHADGLAFQVQYVWTKYREETKGTPDEFDFDCPFSFDNPGDAQMMEILFSKVGIELLDEGLSAFAKADEPGTFSLELYKRFYIELLKVARAESGDLATIKHTEVFGPKGKAEQGLAFEFATRSQSAMRMAFKEVSQYQGLMETLRLIYEEDEQKKKLEEELEKMRQRTIALEISDPERQITPTKVKMIKDMLRLNDK